MSTVKCQTFNFLILIGLSHLVCADFFDNYIEILPPPPQSIGASQKCGEGVLNGKFKCVPYFNCDPLTNTIVDYPEVDGSTHIDPRFNASDARCPGHLQVCCQTNQTRIPESEHVSTVELGFQPKCGIKIPGEFPWMIALLTAENKLICGGSLISPVVVLTAAHCVTNVELHEIKIRTGPGLDKLPYQERNVSEVIINEQFLSSTLYNDVALLILNSSLQNTENVGTICIPNPENVAEDNCFVTGWGGTPPESISYSTSLKQKPVSRITNKQCQDTLRKIIGEDFLLDNSFICARNDSDNVCTGDGGGPLVCSDSSQRYFQVGIVSWGVGCDNWLPGVYTNVAPYKDWIDEKLQELGYKSDPYST